MNMMKVSQVVLSSGAHGFALGLEHFGLDAVAFQGR
jgi:hypothetical protein